MRNSTTPPDLAIAQLAARQHGVVDLGQLHAAGLDRYAIRRRVASGRLHRRYRGVYAVGHTVLTRQGRYLAAVLACGPGAVLSHRSAAALHGLRPSDAARIDVTVPHTSGVRSASAIAVHRSRRRVHTQTAQAIPVTTPMQTLADLAMALPRRQLEKAAENAEARRLLDLTRLDRDHPGSKRLRDAIRHDLATTTRSPLEDAFLELCAAHEVQRPAVNTHVAGYEVDFCWPSARLIVETDSHAHHGTRAAFERDRARDAELTALGWRVLRFTDRQTRGEPLRVAALVRQLLSERSPWLATPG